MFGDLSDPDRGQDGNRREGRQHSGYPAGHLESQSWWCGYGPADDAEARGVRGDRERRPRLVRRRPGRAQGVRAVLRRRGDDPVLVNVDDRRRSTQAPARSRRERSTSSARRRLRRLDWCSCSPRPCSSATGSGRSRASPASTSPASRSTSSRRQAIAAGLGGSGIIVATVIPPESLSPPVACRLRGHDRRAWSSSSSSPRRCAARSGGSTSGRSSSSPPSSASCSSSSRSPGSSSRARDAPGGSEPCYRDRPRCAPDAARVRPARPRHRARLRRGIRPRCSSSPACAGSISRSSTTLGATLVVGVLWFLPAAGVQVLKPYQTSASPGSCTRTAIRAG